MTQWNSSYYRNKNYNRVIKGSVDSIINEFQFLTVESEISSVFLESINKSNNSLTDLTKFIALSPSLAFNILNLAQSPFFNHNKKISSFNDALKVIGNNFAIHLIRDVLAGYSVSAEGRNLKPGINSHYYGCLKSAHLSSLISEELNFSSSFTAYISALLHNVGSFTLSKKFPTQYNRLETSSELSNSELVSAEEHIFGLNHCFLGARMVEHWASFPFIADALFYHHHPLNKIRHASNLVRLVYFSSMIDNSGKSDSSHIIEAGRELFGFTENQIDEYISIAELKVQNRLLHLGIEVSDNNSAVVYNPGYQSERIKLNVAVNNSLISVLVNNVRDCENEKSALSEIGKSLHILTGLREIYYFKYNKSNNSLDGISLKHPEHTDASNDLSISMDAKSSIIVTSFLMGMEINSIDRVNNTEPALFDLQMVNHMGTDGLYCLPLVVNDRATGIIVLGINPGGTFLENDGIKSLRYFAETVASYLFTDETTDNSEFSLNKGNKSDQLQTRKLIHEINNPLSAIKNYLKVLNMKLDDINVENNEIRIIDDELNRISKLLKEFKSSPNDRNTSKTTSSITSILSDTVLLIKNSRLNGPLINIDLKIDKNIPDIMVDKDAFRQVLINLINNSIEAMPRGGNISVGVNSLNASFQEEKHNTGSEKHRKIIEISIADDGPGIPDKLRAGLFKNQSSTKDNHDGLGLLIVHELVKKMGGSITLDAQYNEGACFKITLPAG